MTSSHILKARVSADMKERVQSLAQAQLITESIWLRRLIAAALNVSSTHSQPTAKSDRQARSTDVLTDATRHATRRVCIRLRREDRLLLHDRSSARGLAAATYVG